VAAKYGLDGCEINLALVFALRRRVHCCEDDFVSTKVTVGSPNLQKSLRGLMAYMLQVTLLASVFALHMACDSGECCSTNGRMLTTPTMTMQQHESQKRMQQQQ